MKNTVVIASACRTPIGALMGSLSSMTAGKLAAAVVKSALERAGISPDLVDEVFIGSVLQTGAGQNIARQAAIGAGIPVGTTATTVNMVCGSGMKAVISGIQAILCGDADIVAAGGTESMSNVPYYCKAMRAGNKLGDVTLIDGIVSDGLTDAFSNDHMGFLTEKLAGQYAISREMQDQFAAESQRKAVAAMNSGAFAREIVPIVITDNKGNQTIVSLDEHPRPGTTAEKLAKLRPAFRKDGTITAGNASGINDGAAALVLMSEEKARSLGIRPMAKIVSYASAGVEPENMGIGPVFAVRKALSKAGLSLEDMDLVESNEAFAAQTIAVMKELGLPEAKVNVNGGAIALGHPIGASGARILVTLLFEMQRRRVGKGLATLCIGGGMGSCIVVEMEVENEAEG